MKKIKNYLIGFLMLITATKAVYYTQPVYVSSTYTAPSNANFLRYSGPVQGVHAQPGYYEYQEEQPEYLPDQRIIGIYYSKPVRVEPAEYQRAYLTPVASSTQLQYPSQTSVAPTVYQSEYAIVPTQTVRQVLKEKTLNTSNIGRFSPVPTQKFAKVPKGISQYAEQNENFMPVRRYYASQREFTPEQKALVRSAMYNELVTRRALRTQGNEGFSQSVTPYELLSPEELSSIELPEEQVRFNIPSNIPYGSESYPDDLPFTPNYTDS